MKEHTRDFNALARYRRQKRERREREKAQNGIALDQRKHTETVTIDGEPIAMDDRDSKAFKTYVADVEKALKANGGLMTIRQIKAALSERLVERWLIDALSFSSHVLHVPAYIDRFAYVEKITVKTVVVPNNQIQIAGTAKHKGPDWQEFA